MSSKTLLCLFLFIIAQRAYSQSSTQEEKYYIQVSSKLELRGLIHARYQFFEDTANIDGFDLRRARLDFRGDVAPKIGYRFQVEFAGSPKILDGIFIYKPFDYLNVNVGQSKTPYCYDNLYSPWNILTIGRTQIDNALSGREADLYGNQNGRDIGLWLTGKFSVGEETKRPILEYHLGIYNGTGINISDNNQEKDFGGSLRVSPVKDLWLSGRFYSGHGQTTADPGVTIDRIRYGGDITYKYKNFIIEAELLAGSDESDSLALLNRNGYYITLGFSPIKDKLQVIARFDNYDPDANAENNNTTKYILAASWFFNKNTRIQGEYNLVFEESEEQINNNLFAIQFQVGF